LGFKVIEVIKTYNKETNVAVGSLKQVLFNSIQKIKKLLRIVLFPVIMCSHIEQARIKSRENGNIFAQT